MKNDFEFLTLHETAQYLRVSKVTALRWCNSGKLPAFKLGHQWRVRRQDLAKLTGELEALGELVHA